MNYLVQLLNLISDAEHIIIPTVLMIVWSIALHLVRKNDLKHYLNVTNAYASQVERLLESNTQLTRDLEKAKKDCIDDITELRLTSLEHREDIYRLKNEVKYLREHCDELLPHN